MAFVFKGYILPGVKVVGDLPYLLRAYDLKAKLCYLLLKDLLLGIQLFDPCIDVGYED